MGHKREPAMRYSSPLLVPIAWAELVHFAQVNAVGTYCANCGKGFVISFRQRNRQQFCSRACWEAANKERRRLYHRDYARRRRSQKRGFDATVMQPNREMGGKTGIWGGAKCRKI